MEVIYPKVLISHQDFSTASKRSHCAGFTLWLKHCLQDTKFHYSYSVLIQNLRYSTYWENKNELGLLYGLSKKLNTITSGNKISRSGVSVSGLSLLPSRETPSHNTLDMKVGVPVVLIIALGRQSNKGQTLKAHSPIAVPNFISYHNITLWKSSVLTCFYPRCLTPTISMLFITIMYH